MMLYKVRIVNTPKKMRRNAARRIGERNLEMRGCIARHK